MQFKRIHNRTEASVILEEWYLSLPNKTGSCLGRYRQPNKVVSIYPPDLWEMFIDNEFLSYLDENDHILIEYTKDELVAVIVFECRSEVRRFMQAKCLSFVDMLDKGKASLKGGTTCNQINLKMYMET